MRNLFLSVLFFSATSKAVDSISVYNSLCSQSELFAQRSQFSPLVLGLNGDSILVDKSRKLLHVFSQGQLIRTYNVALGKNPVGKKRQEGDNKTPEGVYFIGYKNSESAYHLSLEVSYPNEEDQDWADEHNVDPGGDIMIHGLPNNPLTHPFLGHPKNNWTRGCIAVTDSEIEEIWEMIQSKTKIEICP